MHAYNCTRKDTTGYTPYELIFERQPHLPIDLAFRLPVDTPTKSHSQYVQDLKNQLHESYEVAAKNSENVEKLNKRRFDERVFDSTLEEGDRVHVRNVWLRGKQKMLDKWEQDIHVVFRKVCDLPVVNQREKLVLSRHCIEICCNATAQYQNRKIVYR